MPGNSDSTAQAESRLPWRQIRWALTGLYLLVTLAITNLTVGSKWRGGSFNAAIKRVIEGPPRRRDSTAVYIVHRLVDLLGTIRVEREIIVLWMLGIFLVQLVGRTWYRAWLTFVSWMPFTFALYLYDFARSVGYRLHGTTPMSVTPQIEADKFFGGGRLPTTILQERFYNPNHIYPYDIVVSGVYTSHFLVPYLFAGYLWTRGQRLWRWYAGMFVAINFTACAIFAGVTTAPPWYAAQKGLIPPFKREIAGRGWSKIGLSLISGAINKGQETVNPYAAIPSLHSAQAMLIVACLWPLVWKWARPVLMIYPLTMTFTLVYAGEHYFVDVLAGWGLVALALTGGWWLRKRFGWTSPFIEPRFAEAEQTEPEEIVPPVFEPEHETDLVVRA